jgi:hypothetical protein
VNISASLVPIPAAIFAAICLGFALTGFSSLGEVVDPVEHSNAIGYACFWTFLALVAAGFGVLAWWLVRTQRSDADG